MGRKLAAVGIARTTEGGLLVHRDLQLPPSPAPGDPRAGGFSKIFSMAMARWIPATCVYNRADNNSVKRGRKKNNILICYNRNTSLILGIAIRIGFGNL